jgi:hypothetical protein
MVTNASLAESLASLARTGTLATLSQKQALELISSTIRGFYDRSATDAILSLEAMVQSLSKTYGESRAMIMLIESFKTVR